MAQSVPPAQPGPAARPASDPSDLASNAQDVARLVVAYVKQETIAPIRGLGRFVAFGLAGSALVGLGMLIVLLGVLRLLQEQTGSVFRGNWSFAPYLLTVAAAAVVAGAALSARGQNPQTRKGDE